MKPISSRLFSTEPLVLASYHNHLCHVKLNRPKALNSLNIEMFELLQQNLKD